MDLVKIRVVTLWKEYLGKVNKKAADSLADPTKYENLFVGLGDCFKAEQYLALQKSFMLASAYPDLTVRRKTRFFNGHQVYYTDCYYLLAKS